jgi:predicted Zn-dependent peptidase
MTNLESPATVKKTILPNGLTVLSEFMPHVRSVSMGIWVRTGSRRERKPISGLSHFIEHMVFKGTEKRSAEQIARESDSIGGMLDAFTSREMVCFNTRVLDEHFSAAFDLLADLVVRPEFAAEEIVREKQVILEEIKMVQDNPEDLVHEVFSEKFWRDHPLGWPILGTPETVGSFERATLRTWYAPWYAPGNLLVTAAGNLRHEQIVDLAAREFGALRPVEDSAGEEIPVPSPQITLRRRRELEQVHICLGVPALPLADPRRFTCAVLNNILGSGMSSRLFQNIRERQGLAYAIFSDLNPYRDAGMLSVYAGTSLASAAQLVRSVMAELRSLKDAPASEEELRRAKNHMKGAYLMSLESSGARMSNLARQHIYFGRCFAPEETLALLEQVTAEEVRQLAREIFLPERIAATVLGNLNGFELIRDQLAC